MRVYILLFIFCLCVNVYAQDFQVPTFPDLNSPTPFLTPTPGVGQTVNDTDIQNLLVTAQSQANIMPTQFAVQGDQVYYENRPLMPEDNQDMSQVFGYAKWLTSSASYSLTGPLSPIVIHLGIFIFLVFGYLVVYYTFLTTKLLIKFMLWSYDMITKAMG